MRTRLSARYSLWIKLPGTFLIFAILFIIAANARITSSIDRVLNTPGVITFAILLFGACFWLVTFLLTAKKIVEFDADFLYVEDVKTATEDKIPLASITWLNMRPYSFSVGAFNYVIYSLHYRDDIGEEHKVRFFIAMISKTKENFVRLVKAKNPDFSVKDWSWSFDFKD